MVTGLVWKRQKKEKEKIYNVSLMQSRVMGVIPHSWPMRRQLGQQVRCAMLSVQCMVVLACWKGQGQVPRAGVSRRVKKRATGLPGMYQRLPCPCSESI